MHHGQSKRGEEEWYKPPPLASCFVLVSSFLVILYLQSTIKETVCVDGGSGVRFHLQWPTVCFSLGISGADRGEAVKLLQ